MIKKKCIDILKTNPDYFEHIHHFKVGKKLWLEIEITDEYMSNMIFAQMYGSTTKKLTTDVYSNSTALGYRILVINQEPGNLSELEKQILFDAQHIINTKLLNKNEK